MRRQSIDQWLESRDDDNTLRVDNGGTEVDVYAWQLPDPATYGSMSTQDVDHAALHGNKVG